MGLGNMLLECHELQSHPFSEIEETLVISVIGEDVLKLNTGILKCQVPNSMKHQVQIVSWKFGNNYIYPTKTWAKGK